MELKSQRNSILPSLRPDPDKASQNRLRDAVQDHLGRVCVGVEDLWTKSADKTRRQR